MAFLYCKDTINGKNKWELADEATVLGRLATCGIVIAEDVISKQHVCFRRRGDHWFINDLASRNGTKLDGAAINEKDKNGEPIVGPEYPLRDGSRIETVRYEFTFYLDHAPTVPPASPTAAEITKPAGSKAKPPSTSAKTDSGQVVMDDDGPDVQSASSTMVSQVDVSSSSGGIHLKASAEARLNALIEITRSLGNTLALDEVLPRVLDSLFKIFTQADRGFIVMEADDGTVVPKWFKVRKGRNEDTLRISRTIVRQAMTTKKAFLSRDATGEFGQSASLADIRIKSMMCAPLLDAAGKAFGALQIDTWNLMNSFSEDDLAVLASVAVQAGIAISSAQLHEQALEQQKVQADLLLAEGVQKAFLPSGFPKIDGYEFFAYYQAANYVGGDYYDFIPLQDGRMAMIVADVAGHGIAAAMMMAKLSAEANFCLLSESNPASAITLLNSRMSAIPVDEGFVTFIMAVLDPRNHTVTLVNAGHMAPIWRHTDNAMDEPSGDVAGLPLRVMDDWEYEAVTVEIQPGEVMVFYTDGINEAEDKQERPYSIDRLRKHISTNPGDVTAVGKAIVEDVRQYIEGLAQFDDMCLLCFARKAE